ncbi:integration host factor, actinobacterial type [Streptodolium elevatio]|uniref:Integration host factor, actinobacterial type n=1 Tax=Streptodolium elevatio TaxID=3157996 RepID=A0ABV3DMP4_9ACTN
MALPELTPETRHAALVKAAAVRRERAAVLTEFRNGTLTLAALLDRSDRVAGKIPVRRVLEALPGVGKIRAARLLLDLDIAENRRLQGLGPRQRDRLLELSPSHQRPDGP